MARTPDPIGDSVELPDGGSDPTIVGEIRRNGTDIKALDGLGVFNLRSGSGLSLGSHRTVDQLVHNIAETSFDEFLYTGARVDSAITWTTPAKTQKIREELYTYTGNKVTTIVTKQYDGAGVLIVGETMTEVLVYSGNQVTSYTRTVT